MRPYLLVAQHKYALDTLRSAKAAGFGFRDSHRDPRLYYVSNDARRSTGAFATHADDFPGCGECGFMVIVRGYLTRCFGRTELRENIFALAGVGAVQQGAFPVIITQKTLTGELQLFPASAKLRRRLQRILGPREIRGCQYELGEICFLATGARPGIRGRLAALAAQVYQLQVHDDSAHDVLRSNRRAALI